MISTRTQLIGSIIATLLGILAVTGYGWRALAKASDAAEDSESYLARIGTVAKLEEQIHHLNASEGEPSVADLAELRLTVADLEAIQWEGSEDRRLVASLSVEVAGGKAFLIAGVGSRVIVVPSMMNARRDPMIGSAVLPR